MKKNSLIIIFLFISNIIAYSQDKVTYDPHPITSSGKPISDKDKLKPGDFLQVEWNGQWWAAKVISLENINQVKIHYLGYADSFDEIVPRSRLQADPQADKKVLVTASDYKNGRPEVGKFARVYKGGEGLEITLLRLGPEANNEFIFKIWGIDHELNGKLFKLKKEGNDQRADYYTFINGNRWVMFTLRTSSGYWFEWKELTVFLPKLTNGIDVYYDKDASGQVIPEHFLTEFLDQVNVQK